MQDTKQKKDSYDFLRKFLAQDFAQNPILAHLQSALMILENFSEIYDEDASNELKKQILKLKDELLAREIWDYFDEILKTKISQTNANEFEKFLKTIKFVRENLILNDIKSSEIWLNFIANYECFLGDESGFYRAKIVELDLRLTPKIYEIFNKLNEKILSFDEENNDFYAICDEILLCELLINLQILNTNFSVNIVQKTLLEKLTIKSKIYKKCTKILDLIKENTMLQNAIITSQISKQMFKIKDKFSEKRAKISRNLDEILHQMSIL